MSYFTVDTIGQNPYIHLWTSKELIRGLIEDSIWFVLTSRPVILIDENYEDYKSGVSKALISYVELKEEEYSLDRRRFKNFDASLNADETPCLILKNRTAEVIDQLSAMDLSGWSLTCRKGRPAVIFADEEDAVLFKMKY